MFAPSSASVLVMRLLWQAVLRYRRRTLLALLLILFSKLATVAVPLALKAVVDAFGSMPDPAIVLPVFLLLGYAALRFLGTLFGEIRDLAFARVTQSAVSGFLMQAFQHLHRLGARFHALRHTGGVTRDVERGAAGVSFLLGVALFTLLPTIVEIVAVVFIIGLNYSNWFTGIIATTFVVYAIFTVVYTEQRAIHQRQLNTLDSNANGRLVDSLLNYEAVKYYTNEDFEQQRFSGILGQWIEVGVANQKALFVLHVGQSAIIAFGVAGVMLLAGQHVVQGQMTVGDLILVNAYVIQVCLPLNSLGFVFRQARDAIVSAERMFRLLEQKPEIVDKPGQTELKVSRGQVSFEHVDFGYEAGRQILWDVSFTIAPGGTVAVVGGSGSGKSTLARLLFRFYDVNAGKISIDGQDISAVSQTSLRSAIGIVPQDTALFNDTIAYNIGYGRPGASLADIIEVARAAHVHDFIASLPEQYDTLVGERGVKLSGGEKQRIAIARAMLKNPPIMVFDEATSALDTRAERAIQEELDRLGRERTTLIIAHRLSTIVDADEILVLEHGRIVERGTHLQLLAKEGVYTQLWQLQRQQQALEQTKHELALQAINFIALLSGVVDGLKPAIDAQGVSFYSTITTESARIVGDPSRLQQVLWTLGERALALTPPGGRIETRVDLVNSSVRLTLSHSVAEAGAEVSGELPLTAPAQGQEMLAIESIVLQHGGALRSQTAADGSGSFILELPLRIATAAVMSLAGRRFSMDADAAASAHAGTLDRIRVLLVDDQDETRRETETLLRSRGAASHAYASGAEALAWLRGLPRSAWPDVMICDIVLRGEDGYEIIQQLRRIEADLGLGLAQRLPAIAIGSRTLAGQRMQALLAGFQVHLATPVEAEELVRAVVGLSGRDDVSPLLSQHPR